MKGNPTVCGAKLRGQGGKTCKGKPMANGRCRLHGGKTPSGAASPQFKHGRYAKAFKGTMAERWAEVQQDRNPLDMVPDLLVQRVMLDTYLERVTSKPKPSLSELENASALAQDTAKTAALIAATRQKQALTLAEIKFIQRGMLMLLEKYVTDPDDRRNFISELSALIPATDEAEEDGPHELPAGTA